MILGEALGNNYYQALHLIFRSKSKRILHSKIFCMIFLAFVDDLKEYSFSFGMYLPPMVRIFKKDISQTIFSPRMNRLPMVMKSLWFVV